MCTASVIVPVYNAEKTLRRCVESIVFGTYRDVEVILVEDHSADESWTLCRELEQQFDNVRALRNDRNRGVSYTRNRGLDAAMGDYILFCDSDDWVSGCYVQELLRMVQCDSSVLPVCGFHFLDQVQNFRQDYVWKVGAAETEDVPVCMAFDVMDKTLLQQLWTKIFKRSIICKKNIRFDESQTIGEDFQFVLDYICCGDISHFRILDKALYYYTRNGGSLMSKFGLIDQENEYARLNALKGLTGDITRYECALAQLKQNYVFHAMRSTLARKEQLEFAKRILGEEAVAFYRQQRFVQVKEKIWNAFAGMLHLWKRICSKIQRLSNQVRVHHLRKWIMVKDVSILSQNCIGGVLYHDMGLQFQSPTIDMYFSGEDFIRFAEEPEKYLAAEPTLWWGEEYPMGRIADVEIHFMHYNSCSEALSAWNRRRTRVRVDRLVMLCTDMEGFSPELFAKWQRIPFPKVLFTADPAYAGEDSVVYLKYSTEKRVADLIPKREFYKNGKVLAAINTIKKDTE